MYKIDRLGLRGGFQKSFTRTDPYTGTRLYAKSNRILQTNNYFLILTCNIRPLRLLLSVAQFTGRMHSFCALSIGPIGRIAKIL